MEFVGATDSADISIDCDFFSQAQLLIRFARALYEYNSNFDQASFSFRVESAISDSNLELWIFNQESNAITAVLLPAGLPLLLVGLAGLAHLPFSAGAHIAENK